MSGVLKPFLLYFDILEVNQEYHFFCLTALGYRDIKFKGILYHIILGYDHYFLQEERLGEHIHQFDSSSCKRINIMLHIGMEDLWQNIVHCCPLVHFSAYYFHM
jgi:hypothetical protein